MFAFVLLPAPGLSGQANSPKSGGSGEGFAIETEMLTYKAVETNSEAVACDLAGYLYGTPIQFPEGQPASRCPLSAPAKPGVIGIVVLPFDDKLPEAFQAWRADMILMRHMIDRAPEGCRAGALSLGSGSAANIAGAAAGAVGMLTPAGAALSLTQGVLGAFAQQTEVSPVVGTVEDQAFINATSRQLRVLGFSVLLPSSYRSYSLTGITRKDEAHSPFLSQFGSFLKVRDCVTDQIAKRSASAEQNHKTDAAQSGAQGQGEKKNPTAPKPEDGDKPGSNESGAAQDSLTSLNNEINTFFTTLTGGTGGAHKVSAGNDSGESAPSALPIGLTDILAIDGIARQLGIEEPDSPEAHEWRQILLLKALESGGSVIKTSNILGSRIRYAGGAVGTFALFDVEGRLECSGNVSDFGGSVSAKHLQAKLNEPYKPDLSAQLIFQKGNSCLAPPPAQ